MKGRKPQLAADANALDASTKPPSWLSKNAKAEWRRVMPELAKRRILTIADLGSLESYCVAMGRVRQLEALLRTDIDLKLLRAQDKSMVTARQLAAELGLTPVSRSRPAVRDNDDQDDDENPLNIV
ncbi:phage terminase small subunit P27 family [Bradyrhizobium genosp. SA-3]|uniref:P27 family phage terminase small subunit n=1 Tax=Bradyrhizobium genosp. SA-3 TaxID=508868 RepID=UPI0010290AE7|nr:P27 family phage terminase small subunit [Bradyrhizobium genosp. SA-3]RZN10289.1 phage terminase small subunit P27 family [Bradyrhizobium genosp. SA-3]